MACKNIKLKIYWAGNVQRAEKAPDIKKKIKIEQSIKLKR
jgi:hypothetical protein